jgi:MGT family glycosyltransferase
MAHYALVGPDDGGHLLSMGSLGKELVERGHRVTVIAREKAASLAEQFDLEFHPWNADDIDWPSDTLNWMAFSLLGFRGTIDGRCWMRWQNEAILRLLPRLLRELAVDGVLFDHVLPAGGTAAERAKVPFVSVCTALPWNEDASVPPSFTSWPYADDLWSVRRNRWGYAGWRWYIRPILNRINFYRRRWNMPLLSHIDQALSPLAQISQLCVDYDYPRRELSDVFHYIGSLTANREIKGEPPFLWERLDGRPLVFASLGTVQAHAKLPVFQKILSGCADLDVQLVLAMGQTDEQEDSVREKLGEIPDNAIVVDFAPQLTLLNKASLLITHAGVNTVLEAACRGLPVLALPRTCDQFGMGTRIRRAGVGLVTSFRRSTSDQIRRLVQKILAEESFRTQAGAMQEAMIAAGGVRRAADIAEEALLTRQPVLRNIQRHSIQSPHLRTVTALADSIRR